MDLNLIPKVLEITCICMVAIVAIVVVYSIPKSRTTNKTGKKTENILVKDGGKR